MHNTPCTTTITHLPSSPLPLSSPSLLSFLPFLSILSSPLSSPPLISSSPLSHLLLSPLSHLLLSPSHNKPNNHTINISSVFLVTKYAREVNNKENTDEENVMNV
jgi:hypothetical protein